MVNPEFVERCQLIFEKDPTSKVFAPLTEAYRRMGLIDAALEVGRRGVALHPTFAGGRLALAKALVDKGMFTEALSHLKEVCELSPENLLAHNLLGEVYLKLREPKLALKAFKMVLFLNAQDERARKNVARLESLTADEYEAEVFAPARLDVLLVDEQPGTPEYQKELQRVISLVDAFLGRNDGDKASQLLSHALAKLGRHPALLQRWDFLQDLSGDAVQTAPPKAVVNAPTEQPERLTPLGATSNRSELGLLPKERKVQKLRRLLERVNQMRLQTQP